MGRWALVIGMLVIGGVYLATTLIPESGSAASKLSKVPCWFDAPNGWRPACYRLTVPESREADNGRQVSLPVVVMRSPTADRNSAPILHIMGGPGQPAQITDSESIAGWADFLSAAAWTHDRDHILYDSRGIGPLASPQMRCNLLSDIDTSIALDKLEEGSAEWRAAMETTVGFCRGSLTRQGIDIAAYNTTEATADLVDLRKALGIEKWVPYGVSYGTRIALQLMRTDADAIEAVILDSVHPLHVPGWADALTYLDKRLKDLFAACAEQEDCRETYGDLDTVFERVVRRLKESPVEMTLKPKEGGRAVTLNADDGDFVTVLEYSLLMGEAIELIPLLIDMVDHRDYSLFKTIGEQIMFDAYYDDDANALTYSTQCREGMAQNPPEAFAAARIAAPLLAGFDFEQPLRTACEIWDVGDAPDGFSNPVESDLPVLLINGAFDPRTPYEWAIDQAGFLPNAKMVLISNAGHGPSVTDACAMAAMGAFLEAPLDYQPPACLNRQLGPWFLSDPGEPDQML